MEDAKTPRQLRDEEVSIIAALLASQPDSVGTLAQAAPA
jgi:hypothetical protein